MGWGVGHSRRDMVLHSRVCWRYPFRWNLTLKHVHQSFTNFTFYCENVGYAKYRVFQ